MIFNSQHIYLLAFLAGVLLASCNARGAELIVHGPSHHFDNTDYNSATYGLGYRFDNNVVVGSYKNSIDRQSVYGGYLLQANRYVGLLVGAVTGYEQHTVWPAAVLVLTAPISKSFNLHLNLAPVNGGFINLSVGVKL